MPSKTKILDGKKRCGHCKNMLPVSEFNACKHAATGFRSQCKRCMKDQREKMRPYYQGWRKQGHVAEWYKAYAKRRWRTDTKKAKARNAVRSLDRKPCEVCGAEKAEAHHQDYDFPLDVMWLCRRHHIEWHLANGPGKNG